MIAITYSYNNDILVNYNNIKYIKCFKIYNALSNII